MLYVRLSTEMDARLGKIAKQLARTKTSIARDALIGHIADLEDLAEAERRYADILSGKSKTIPLEDVIKELGLED